MGACVLKIIDEGQFKNIKCYLIECEKCTIAFNVLSTQWWAKCPNCENQQHLGILREEYLGDVEIVYNWMKGP